MNRCGYCGIWIAEPSEAQIERVARAMCEKAGTAWSDTSAEEYAPPLISRPFWLQQARAAIEAMNVPPDGAWLLGHYGVEMLGAMIAVTATYWTAVLPGAGWPWFLLAIWTGPT